MIISNILYKRVKAITSYYYQGKILIFAYVTPNTQFGKNPKSDSSIVPISNISSNRLVVIPYNCNKKCFEEIVTLMVFVRLPIMPSSINVCSNEHNIFISVHVNSDVSLNNNINVTGSRNRTSTLLIRMNSCYKIQNSVNIINGLAVFPEQTGSLPPSIMCIEDTVYFLSTYTNYIQSPVSSQLIMTESGIPNMFYGTWNTHTRLLDLQITRNKTGVFAGSLVPSDCGNSIFWSFNFNGSLNFYGRKLVSKGRDTLAIVETGNSCPRLSVKQSKLLGDTPNSERSNLIYVSNMAYRNNKLYISGYVNGEYPSLCINENETTQFVSAIDSHNMESIWSKTIDTSLNAYVNNIFNSIRLHISHDTLIVSSNYWANLYIGEHDKMYGSGSSDMYMARMDLCNGKLLDLSRVTDVEVNGSLTVLKNTFYILINRSVNFDFSSISLVIQNN